MTASLAIPVRGHFALEPLVAAPAPRSAARGGPLPDWLRERYGGDLAIPLVSRRPTVVANFVSTLDGVVSYNTPEAAGGGEISGFFEPDRFVMGLLRALADVVLIGAGTLRAAPDEAWTPGFIHRPSRHAFASLRHELGLAPNPTTVVVTASGHVDLAHPGLSLSGADALVVTGEAGAAALARQGAPAGVRIRTVASTRVWPDLLGVLADEGARLVVCEGGPHLLGQLGAADVLDELFLTVAPQIAGRSESTPRLGLMEDMAFRVADAPWAQLIDLRRAASHLFARYRLLHDERKER